MCLWRRRPLRFARNTTASLIASLLLRCIRRVPVAPSVPSLRSSHDGVAHCFASLASQTACACGAVGPFASLVTWRRRSLLRFSCVANGVCLWRRRSLRFARHMTASLIASLLLCCKRRVPVASSVPSLRSSHDASLIASLLLRCKRRVPVAPSVPSLRSSHDGVAHCFASLALQTTCAVAPSVPSLRSSHGDVAHCFASLVMQAACACGAVGLIASLVTRHRRSLLRFSCVANDVCLWRRRSLRFARHMTASLIASRLLRCKRRVPVALLAPSLRSSHDGVAHCFASLASQTACACGAVGPFASLVTWRCCSLLRFSCVANWSSIELMFLWGRGK